MGILTSLHGVLVFVPDLAVGCSFYRDTLGFEVVRRSDKHVEMRGAGIDLTLFRCERSTSSGEYSNRAGSSLAFAVTSIEASMAALRVRGVEFLHAAPEQGPVGRYAAFADPFGTVHELVEVGAARDAG